MFVHHEFSCILQRLKTIALKKKRKEKKVEEKMGSASNTTEILKKASFWRRLTWLSFGIGEMGLLWAFIMGYLIHCIRHGSAPKKWMLFRWYLTTRYGAKLRVCLLSNHSIEDKSNTSIERQNGSTNLTFYKSGEMIALTQDCFCQCLHIQIILADS